MSSRKIIKDQSDETWSKLHKRLTSSDADFSKVFKEDIVKFFKAKAQSIGTNIGYYVMCVLTTVNLIASFKKVKISLRGDHSLGMNLFSIFVGPPSTSKSPAFKDAVTVPLQNFPELNILTITTSSGLTKLLSRSNTCFLANPEISEYLLRMMMKMPLAIVKYCASCFRGKSVR